MCVRILAQGTRYKAKIKIKKLVIAALVYSSLEDASGHNDS